MSEHTDRAGSLFRHSMMMFVMMGVANLANIFFHMGMGRMLDPVDYGVLMTMVGILYILNVPAETLRASLAFYSAKNHSETAGALRAEDLFWLAIHRLLFAAGPCLLLVVLLIPVLNRFFHIEGSGPILTTALICFAMLLMTTMQGILQGKQKFLWYGISMNLWFWGRLVLAISLVYAGYRATGALGGMLGGVCLALVVPYIFQRKLLQRTGEKPVTELRPVYKYIGLSMCLYAFFMLQSNLDVIAVKHYFNPEDAGLFAQGALLTHFIWMLPFPIVMTMFPKVVHSKAGSRKSHHLLIKSLIVGVLLVALFAVGVWLGSVRLFGLLFKNPAHPMIPYMPGFLCAMVPLSILFVLFHYEMACERFIILLPMVAGVVALIAVFHVSHFSYGDILRPLIIINWITMLAAALLTVYSECRKPD